MQHDDNDLHWPTSAPPSLIHAQLRVAPEDFVVEEVNGIALTGAGEHLWVQLRKRGMNTEFAARQLARAAGVPPRAVSFAGLKDRHAVTTQWFSIHLPGREIADLAGRLPEEIDLLAMQRHARKLQRGALEANRFRIVLRECEGNAALLEQRIAEIGRYGVPNYFGAQRFGRGGGNIARARALFAGEPIRDRHLRGIYLSAARSLIFNEVLAQRVADGSWHKALAGDVFILSGSNSYFVPEALDASIEQRLESGDIHPSGPLWGEGEPPSRGVVRVLECETAQRHTALADGLAQAGLRQERRALCLLPREMTLLWIDSKTVALSFLLPAGSYATVVLQELAKYQDRGGDAG
jgi:tRNA pseudouridine13 synthase